MIGLAHIVRGAEVFRGNFLVGETTVSEDRLYKLDTTMVVQIRGRQPCLP